MPSLLSMFIVVVTAGCGGQPAAFFTSGSGGSTSTDTSSGNTTSTTTGSSGGGACIDDSLEAGTHTVEIEHDGKQRSYRLHLPVTYDNSTPLPLVMNFHGYTMNMDLEASFTGMDDAADAKGYAVVYPNGIESSWNGGALCCGTAAEQMVDDVGFARSVVADISARACIDTKRIYSTGFSNGGFLSHRIACEAADLVAAVAPVAGLLGISAESCQPTRPVPIVHFYGVADQLVDYQWADDVNALWVSRNGCTGSPEISVQVGQTVCETHDQCEGGVSVTLCSVAGMGHCWPGQPNCAYGVANVDISANDIMWELFAQHALP